MTEDNTFVLFGTDHLTVLAAIVILCLVVSRVPARDRPRGVAWALALLLVGSALMKPVLYIGIHGEPWGNSLPLDLCRVNEFMCAYMLIMRSYGIFQISYFLSMAGSVSALVMPDLVHAFPDPRFLLFFLSHGLALVATIYAVFAYGFRPTLHSVGLALAFLGIYALVIAVLNPILDANYLFLREKPQGASVLDSMGPWPLYIIGMIVIAIVACFVCYLPFAFRRRRPVRAVAPEGNAAGDGQRDL